MINVTRWVIITLITIFLFSCTSSPKQHKQTNAPVSEAKQQEAAALNTKLAQEYMQQGKMPEAKEKLFLALQQSPNSLAANSTMAYYLEEVGDVKNAEAYYRKAIHIADIKGAAENNYGAFLCRQHRYAEADKQFQLAVKDPHYVNTAKAYENAGLCAELVPDPAKAKEYFTKALQHDPKLTTSAAHLAKLQ